MLKFTQYSLNSWCRAFAKALPILSLFIPVSAFSQNGDDEKWYEVELVVFSQGTTAGIESEKWPPNPGSPNLTGVYELRTPLEQLMLLDDVDKDSPLFNQLGEDELSMKEIAEIIALNPEVNLLLHTGWRQSVTRGKNAVRVFVDDNKISYAEELEDEESTSSGTLLDTGTTGLTTELSSPSPEVLLNEGPPQTILYGTVGLKLSRFLHLVFDLSYRAPDYQFEQVAPEKAEVIEFADKTEAPATGEFINTSQAITADDVPIRYLDTDPFTTVAYRIRESRKVRLKKYYYIDHPVFGIIARVNSWTPPESVENVEGGNSAPIN